MANVHAQVHYTLIAAWYGSAKRSGRPCRLLMIGHIDRIATALSTNSLRVGNVSLVQQQRSETEKPDRPGVMTVL